MQFSKMSIKLTAFPNLHNRTKITRIFTLVLILGLLTVLLVVSDTFINKIHSRKFSASCVLCPLRNETYEPNAKLLQFTIFLSGNEQRHPVNIMLFFVHAQNNLKLKSKLNRCISSLYNYATPPLNLHILTDAVSLDHAVQVLKETAPLAKTSIQVSLYNVDIFMKPLEGLIDALRPHFSFKLGAYYSDRLFYISIGLFKVMNLQRIILIDADVKFLDDVKLLYDYFSIFPPEALVGIAREQQPVYRHVLHEYRRQHNDTRVGGPPPNGITGFNSGVLLLDLEKMRNSSLYFDIINNSSFILKLLDKYKFKGHLGDQDFYSLISIDYSHLFYILPCTWNRQLCQWWKHHGYKDVFDSYNSCTGKVHLVHGNCNSAIPDS